MLCATCCIAVCLGAPIDPASIAAADVRSAIDAISEAIIDAYHPTRHWDPVQMPGGESTRQHLGGYTALATLALLTAGHDAQSSPLREAIAWLESVEPDGTYAVAFRAQVWASLPDRFLPQLQHDVDRLVESFHWEQGGWDYLCRPVERIPRVSPSTRHVAVLALHAAADRGIRVPPKLLARVESATIESQHKDGGWSYHIGDSPTGSMTAAGVFSLVLVQDLLDKSSRTRTKSIRETAIENGRLWLDERFTADPCPGLGRCAKFPQYWLYSLERVALATGWRTLAGRDWLRDALSTTLGRLCRRDTHGQWHVSGGKSVSQLRQRCFALMLLHRGLAPLACAQLTLPGQSIEHDSAALLVDRLQRTLEHETSWQQISMSDSVDVWLESPMVLIQGAREPSFVRDRRRDITAALRGEAATPNIEEVQLFSEYLKRGGLLVAVARSSGFGSAMKQIGSLASPHATWRRLTRKDPALSLLDSPRTLPRIDALSAGGRDLMLLISGRPDGVLPNIWAMATERHPFPPRMNMSPIAKATAVTGTPCPIVFAAGENAGFEPGAATAFSQWCEQSGKHARCLNTSLVEASDHHGLVTACAGDSETDWAAIETLLSRGRTVLLTGPPSAVAAHQRRAALAGIVLSPTHRASWTSGLDVSWRPFSRQHGLARPGLDLLAGQYPRGGTLVLAPSDLLQALLGRPCWGVHGCDTATARSLIWRLARHVQQDDNRSPATYGARSERMYARTKVDMVDNLTGRAHWSDRGPVGNAIAVRPRRHP